MLWKRWAIISGHDDKERDACSQSDNQDCVFLFKQKTYWLLWDSRRLSVVCRGFWRLYKHEKKQWLVWWARNNSAVQMIHAVRGAEGVLLMKNKIKSLPHWILLSWSNNVISKQVENMFIFHFCHGIVCFYVLKTPQQCLLAHLDNSELSLAVLSNFLLEVIWWFLHQKIALLNKY